MGGYVYNAVANQVHPITWTIPHCVLVLKLIGTIYLLWVWSHMYVAMHVCVCVFIYLYACLSSVGVGVCVCEL